MTTEIKELKVSGNEIVVQDNNLIDSPKLMSLQEQKLFLFLISKINPTNPENVVFRVSITEFAKAISVQNENNTYVEVRKIVKKLMTRIVTISQEINNIKTTLDLPILEYARYWHGKGYADIKISK